MIIHTIDPGKAIGYVKAHISKGGNRLHCQVQHITTLEFSDLIPLWKIIKQHSENNEHQRFVIEQFVLYPWMADKLAWNDFVASRVIGVFQFISKLYEIPLVLQPANARKHKMKVIKQRLVLPKPRSYCQHELDALSHLFHYFLKNKKELKAYFNE